MEKEIKICCITGNRPEKFPWDYYNEALNSQKEYRLILRKTLEDYINKGYTYFLSGGARGVDIDFAELVLDFRKIYPNLQLEMVIPYKGQDSAYNESEKRRYQILLSQANKISIINEHYTRGCMHQRNRYMIDKSLAVIAFWNIRLKGGTYNSIRYAEKRNKELKLICLQDFMKSYKEIQRVLTDAVERILK